MVGYFEKSNCLALAIALGCIGWFISIATADSPADIEAILAAGKATKALKNSSGAAWTAVYNLPGGAEFQLKCASAPGKRAMTAIYKERFRPEEMLRIVDRDNRWFVTEAGVKTVYKPYAAPVLLPVLYTLFSEADLRIADDPKQLGTLVKQESGIAFFRSPLRQSKIDELNQSLAALEKFEKEKRSNKTVETIKAKKKIAQTLSDGIPIQVDVKHGIVTQAPVVGNQVSYRDFRILTSGDETIFNVTPSDYTDRSKDFLPTVEQNANDVVMITNQPTWILGAAPGDMDFLFLNIVSGETRRIPYRFGAVLNGCWSKDRDKIYIAGYKPELESLTIDEMELLTGSLRPLGSEALQTGMTCCPTLSPNGKYLAVFHKEAHGNGQMHSRIHVIDIASGKSRAVGEPRDIYHLSWLPRDEGLVFVEREGIPPKDKTFITMSNFSGTSKRIIEGNYPCILSNPDKILFFDASDKHWKTCNVDGTEATVFHDGLPSLAYPTPSPDSQRLFMMQFISNAPPKPVLVDRKTGELNHIKVGPGLWANPQWQ